MEEAAESSDDSLITVAKSLNDALETDHPDFRSRLLAIALCGLVRIAYEELGGELLNNITSEYVHNWLWLLRIWYQEYSASILVEHKEPEISSWGQRYSPETIERDIEHTTELLSDDFALIYPDALLIPYQELGRPRPDILDAFEAEAYFEAALENGHAEALEVNELKHRLLNRLYLVAKLLHDRRLNVRRHLVPLPHLDTSRREWFLQDEIPQTLSDEILSLSDEIAYRKLRFLYSNNGIDIPEYNKLGSQKISINGIRHFTDTSRFIEEARRKYDKEIIISGATEDFEEVFSAFGPGYVAIPVNASKSEYLAARSCFVKDIRLGDMWAVEFDYKLSRYFDLLLEHWRLLEPFRQRSIDAMIRSEREAEQSSSIHEKDVQAGVRAEAEIEAEALEVLGFDINMRHDLKYDWSRQGYALTEELIQWYRTSSM